MPACCLVGRADDPARVLTCSIVVELGGEKASPLALNSWHRSRKRDPLGAAHAPSSHCHDGIDPSLLR